MSELDAIARLYAAVDQGPPVSEEALAEAEARLGVRLPASLREFYRRFSCNGPLGTAQERLLSPEEWDLRNGCVVFCVENQGAVFWGFPADRAFEDDPPVLRAEQAEIPEWDPDHDRLSDFWITFAYWQAVNGAWGNVAVAMEAEAAVMEAVEHLWPELPLGPNQWQVRFFGNERVVLCLLDDGPIQVAGRSVGDVLAAGKAVGIE